MLIKATPEDIKKYGEFAYSVALNPKKSCYPTYADGIKTKTDFFKAAERAIAKETYEQMCIRDRNKPCGTPRVSVILPRSMYINESQ